MRNPAMRKPTLLRDVHADARYGRQPDARKQVPTLSNGSCLLVVAYLVLAWSAIGFGLFTLLHA